VLDGPMPRIHKGDRDQMTTRPPREVGELVRAKAKEAGVPVGDMIAAILSEYVQLSHLLPIPSTITQQELELPRTA